MRCKRHPFEAGVGVCASCLRERLLALIAAQVKDVESPDDRRKSDAHPPPLVFPRSVSPYVSRRSAAGDTWHSHNQFYSTPQIGPNTRKNKSGRFSRLSSFFHPRSDAVDSDPRPSNASWLSSPSWITNLLRGGRKKKSRLFSFEGEIPATGGCRQAHRTANRGMSPVTSGMVRDEGYDTPPGSGYSSESSTGFRRTPGPSRCRMGPAQSRNPPGFAFCLSPLVRASPKSNRLDNGFSGEIRNANRHHLSTAASLGANRSRKLTDFGRYP